MSVGSEFVAAPEAPPPLAVTEFVSVTPGLLLSIPAGTLTLTRTGPGEDPPVIGAFVLHAADDAAGVHVQPVPLTAPIMSPAGNAGNTRYRRKLDGSEYNSRRTQCEQAAQLLGIACLRDGNLTDLESKRSLLSELQYKRSRFIIEEIGRVLTLANSLPAGDAIAINRICAASFAGAIELYEIGVPAMAAMVQSILSAPGCIGARQAGAGFGGCMVAFVRRECLAEFVFSVEHTYQCETGIQPEVYAVEAADGVGLVKM